MLGGFFDLLELATGDRGMPADKEQSVAILSIREERLSGRCRLFTHVSTPIMLADGLTKLGLFSLLSRFLSTGIWDTTLSTTTKANGKSIQITTRILAPTRDFDEGTLINLKG